MTTEKFYRQRWRQPPTKQMMFWFVATLILLEHFHTLHIRTIEVDEDIGYAAIDGVFQITVFYYCGLKYIITVLNLCGVNNRNLCTFLCKIVLNCVSLVFSLTILFHQTLFSTRSTWIIIQMIFRKQYIKCECWNRDVEEWERTSEKGEKLRAK